MSVILWFSVILNFTSLLSSSSAPLDNRFCYITFEAMSYLQALEAYSTLLSWLGELPPAFQSKDEVCCLAHGLHGSRVNESSCFSTTRL